MEFLLLAVLGPSMLAIGAIIFTALDRD